MKRVLCALLPLLSCVALSATKVVSGKLTLAESGRILIDGRIEAKPDSKTRFWASRAATTAMLPVGASVTARIADDGTLRELADSATYEWLAAIRKDPQEATFVVEENGRMRFALAKGGEFSYRRTPTSKVDPKTPAAGTKMWVLGRLMANGDTRIAAASTAPPSQPPKSGPKTGNAMKYHATPTSGTYEGSLVTHNPANWSLLVRYDGKLYTMLYSSTTKFFMDGERVNPAALEAGMEIELRCRTDRFGRILLSRVELL